MINEKLNSEYVESERFTAVNLTTEDMIGKHFKDCVFFGCQFGVISIDNTTFSRCVFQNCQFDHTHGTGIWLGECTFSTCDMRNVSLSGIFTDCQFAITTIMNSDIRGSMIERCRFDNVSEIKDTFIVNTILKLCTFDECDLDGIVFSDINTEENDDGSTSIISGLASRIESCKFNRCSMQYAKYAACVIFRSEFTSCVMCYSDMRFVSFTHGKIDTCKMIESDFEQSHFQLATIGDVNMHQSTTTQVEFKCCTMRKVDMTHCVLKDSTFKGSTMSRMDWRGTYFSNTDLDMASFPMSCESFDINCDDIRLPAQLAYHLCRLVSDDPLVKDAIKALLPLAEKFHRHEECGNIHEFYGERYGQDEYTAEDGGDEY